MSINKEFTDLTDLKKVKTSRTTGSPTTEEEFELDPDIGNSEPTSDMPANSNVLILTICLVNLFANSAYSSIAPFYPGEAVAKGVPESVLGFVFSSYSVAMFIFSPLYKVMLDRFGSKKQLLLGLLCEGVAMIVFGLFDYIENPTAYAGCSMLCRFLEGFGNGCLNSGCKFRFLTL